MNVFLPCMRPRVSFHSTAPRSGKNIDFGESGCGSGFRRKGTRCTQELNVFQGDRWLHGERPSGGRGDFASGFLLAVPFLSGHSVTSLFLAANVLYSAGLNLAIFPPRYLGSEARLAR